MKKNITINLYGTLYAIDEDAYALLDKYLDNMRGYFGRRAGGDEIADDIERRVAELFSELSEQGVAAITVEHVRGIISRIGNPEEMDAAQDEDAADNSAGGTSSASGATPPPPPGGSGSWQRTGKDMLGQLREWLAARRFYRDTENQMAGGVIAGAAKYFGATDPLPWRILFVLLCCVTFTMPVLLYLLLWALVPEAVTAEEKLRMCGKPVSPSTLNDELMREDKAKARPAGTQTSARGFVGTLLSVVVFLFKIFLLVLCVVPAVSLVFFTIVLSGLTFGGGSFVQTFSDDPDSVVSVMGAVPEALWMFWAADLCGFVALGIVLFLLIRWIVKSRADKRLSFSAKTALVALFVVSLTSSVTLFVGAGFRVKEASHRLNTYNGVYITPSQKDALERSNWTIASVQNCNSDGDFVAYTDVHKGGQSLYSIEGVRAEKDDRRASGSLKAYKQKYFPAGMYHIEAVSGALGRATLTLYAETADGRRTIASFPAAQTVAKGLLVQTDSLSCRMDGLFPLSVDWADNVAVATKTSGVCDDVCCDGRVALLRTGSFRLGGGQTRYGFSATLPSGAGKLDVVDVWLVPDSVAAVQ